MKKVLFYIALFSITIMSCAKDDLPIDAFVGTHNGNLKEYTCDSNVLVDTKTGIVAEITKDNDTDVTGVVSENGTELFSFSAKLDTANEKSIKISQFAYNSTSYFGAGNLSNGSIELQFATTSCPKEGNTYGVTLIFK